MHPVFGLHISLNTLILLKMYKDTSQKNKFYNWITPSGAISSDGSWTIWTAMY